MDFNERYTYDPKKDQIGTGGFSKIYKGYDSLREEEVALKFFSGDVKEKYGIMAEAKRLLKLNHPNVIKFHDLDSVEFTDFHNQKERILVGILEYVDGGDLKQAIGQQLTESAKLEIVEGILKGLKYIHKKGLIHRDIKPGNILLSHEDDAIVAKLIDFGISKNADEDGTASSQLLGTVEYMAPEQFNSSKYGKVTTATDLWSFGVMVYELYTGNRLFGGRGEGQQTEEVISNVLLGTYEIDHTLIPEAVTPLLMACLVRNPLERASTADQLLELLNNHKQNTISTVANAAITQNQTEELKDVAKSNAAMQESNSSTLEEYEVTEVLPVAKKVTSESVIKPLTKKVEVETQIGIDDKSTIAVSTESKRTNEVNVQASKSKKPILYIGAAVVAVILLFVWSPWSSSGNQSDLEIANLENDAEPVNIEETIEYHFELARNYHEQNEGEKKMIHLTKALALCDSFNISNRYLHQYAGSSYIESGDLDIAKGYLELALEEAIVEDNLSVSVICSEIAHIFFLKGSYDDAIEAYFKAIESAQTFDDKHGMVEIFKNIGDIYKRTGDLELALTYFKKSLTTAAEIQDMKSIATTSLTIGNVFFTKNSLDSAMKYYVKSKRISGEIGLKKVRSKAKRAIVDIQILWDKVNEEKESSSTEIIIPNFITPNGDGLNDNLKIPNLHANYPLCKVEVFNVFGELVFESTGYKIPWDGTSEGELVPAGVYVYQISELGSLETLRGSITVAINK
ncbi:MAG: protein kinase [Flavobacteriales bacterium]|nr:protein kinase [Flavobacteriales bacterium]